MWEPKQAYNWNVDVIVDKCQGLIRAIKTFLTDFETVPVNACSVCNAVCDCGGQITLLSP